MAKHHGIHMTMEKARRLVRLLNLRLRGQGCEVTETKEGWDIIVHPVGRSDASSVQSPGTATVAEEHDNYLLLRPVGLAADDASLDFPVRKPRDLRRQSYDGERLVDRVGGVDIATNTGNHSKRRLTSIDDEEDFEDQVVNPPYIEGQTVNVSGVATYIPGSLIEYGPVASGDDDPIIDDNGNEMPPIPFVDLNRTVGRAFAEDNGS